ncbi:MAG: pyridoxal-phosphate dependent enzyme [Flavobacteriales bacterium]|nr:pyridoxal-phosphate dependent enzyme [Flavobacteriales bacterium]
MNESVFDLNTPIQGLHDYFGFPVYLKRDDLIHPFISGNKWRKLKYNILAAREQGFSGICTFGGAYSNHLIAVACACACAGLRSIGFVRGDELKEDSNFVLRLCDEFGMELRFLTREDYRAKKEAVKSDHIPGYLVVPEGGANWEGILGCEEIFDDEPAQLGITDIVCAVGTATTFCGLIRSFAPKIRVHGIAVMRGAGYLEDFIRANCPDDPDNWILHEAFCRKGFGKSDPQLLEEMRRFSRSTGILLDPVYTGKMIMAIPQMRESGLFAGDRVLALHSGGLTGLLSDRTQA